MDSTPSTGPPDHDLRRVIRILLRDAHAPGLTPGRAEQLLDEAHELLGRLVEDDTLHLRVRVDGVFRDDEELLGIDPQRDARAFRLFQHGVRQITFSPGIERSEIADLVAVIRTDWTKAQHLEDDIVTLIGGMELAAIHLVVVETFTESGEGEDEDVVAIVASGLRANLEAIEEAREGHEPVVRLWEADVAFLESDLAEQLSETLAGRADSAESGLDAAADGLRAELEDGIRHAGRWLVGPALAIAQLSSADERARLREILAYQLLGEAAAAEDPTAALEDLLRQRELHRSSTRDSDLVDDLLEPTLEKLAIAALSGSRSTSAAALDVLVNATPGGGSEVLRTIAKLPASEARDGALIALTEMSGGALAAAAIELLHQLDPRASTALLHGLRHAPLAPETLELFRSALGSVSPEARARGLGWLNYQAPDHAVKELGSALRADDRMLRMSALWLVLRSRPAVSRALVSSWYGSPECGALELDDRRLATLAYVKLVGNAALDSLRKTAKSSAFRRRAKEARAAAIAGLGALRDAESRPLIESLAKNRGGDDPVANEAGRVIDALHSGQRPYLDPLAFVEDELSAEGVLDALGVSETDLAPATEEPAGDGFSVRSKALSEHPSNRPPALDAELEAFSVRSSSLAPAMSTAEPGSDHPARVPASLSSLPPGIAPALESGPPVPDLDLTAPAVGALKAPRAPGLDLDAFLDDVAPKVSPVPTVSQSRGFRPPSSAPPPRKKQSFRPPSVAGAKRPAFRRPSSAPPGKPASIRPPSIVSASASTPAATSSSGQSEVDELEALLDAYESELPPSRGDDE